MKKEKATEDIGKSRLNYVFEPQIDLDKVYSRSCITRYIRNFIIITITIPIIFQISVIVQLVWRHANKGKTPGLQS